MNYENEVKEKWGQTEPITNTLKKHRVIQKKSSIF